MTKGNTNRSKLTDNDICKIHELAAKGISDSVISKKLNITYSIVQRISTDYWNQKMKQANG